MSERDGTTPTMVDVLDKFEQAVRRRIRTALPGRIKSYDASTERAEVEPQVPSILRKRATGERVLEWPPVLPNVPVQFPGGGGVRITWPLKKGDAVTLLVHDRMIEEWLRTGERTDPGDERMQHLGAAVALPGLMDEHEVSGAGGAEPTHMVIETPGGVNIHLGSKNPAAKLARADRVESELAAIKAALDSAAAPSGAVTYGTKYNEVGSVGADKVKGD